MYLLHMEGCLNADATIDEIMETLKNGVVSGGSIIYPLTLRNYGLHLSWNVIHSFFRLKKKF